MFNPPDEDWALSNAYWMARLSNNKIVYGDGNDPSTPHEGVWTKLKEYLSLNKDIRIKEIIFKFRSNEVHFDIPVESTCVYFSKGLGKEWVTNQQDKFFIVGIQSTDYVIEKHWYQIPELVHHKTVASEIKDLDTDFLCFFPKLDIM